MRGTNFTAVANCSELGGNLHSSEMATDEESGVVSFIRSFVSMANYEALSGLVPEQCSSLMTVTSPPSRLVSG